MVDTGLLYVYIPFQKLKTEQEKTDAKKNVSHYARSGSDSAH
jgi:hypothetical protein